MTVAADPDPYFSFPRLVGAPAYARPPRVVPERERPLDPDDLPIAAEQTDEEREITSTLHPATFGVPAGFAWARSGEGSGASRGAGHDDAGRRVGLRALTDHLVPRQK